MAEHAVSPLTVQKALRLLTREGLVEARPGVGTFVRAVRAPRAVDHSWQTSALRDPRHQISGASAVLRSVGSDLIAWHAGYPDRELLPERLVRAALTRAARGDQVVDRVPSAGLPALQSWFAQQIADQVTGQGTPPTAHDVIITPGSQSGLASVFRSLVPPGEALLMEAPSYFGAIRAAQRAGVRIVPVTSGPHGPDPDDLDRALVETGARVFYAQPTYANPTGAQWSEQVQQQVLAVVRRRHAFLVEDDWAHDFGITTAPAPVVAHDSDGHVIHLRSLTKSASPAVRVGAVIARGPVRARILADRDAESMYVSGLLQAAALDVVTHPGWTAHLRRTREALRQRRDLMVTVLADHAPQVELTHLPAGGLNLWLQLPDHVDAVALALDCERRGLLVAPGPEWFPAEPTGSFLRVNYSGPNPGAWSEGARILGESVRELAGRS